VGRGTSAALGPRRAWNSAEGLAPHAYGRAAILASRAAGRVVCLCSAPCIDL
ncbi:hypothetical protein HAX54_017369, partial [Datura stramonium]|nr:hypothetical protein [Datura stramonium]